MSRPFSPRNAQPSPTHCHHGHRVRHGHEIGIATVHDDVAVSISVRVLEGLQFALAGDGRVAEDDPPEAAALREALRRPGVEALGERPRETPCPARSSAS